MSDAPAPDVLNSIDAFYDATLKPELDALDEFEIYVSEETEARALLTPAMTAALVALRQGAGKPS